MKSVQKKVNNGFQMYNEVKPQVKDDSWGRSLSSIFTPMYKYTSRIIAHIEAEAKHESSQNNRRDQTS